MLKIADISHWQGMISWKNTFLDAVIIKCSQGTKSVDPMFAQNKAGARRTGILCGFYHFANSEDPKAEANHFVQSVGDVQQGELLALDAETGQSPQWCRTFLDEVTRLVGFKPLIYCPAGNGWNWQPVVDGNYGLWIARYGWNTGIRLLTFPPKIGQWPFYAIWQYTSRGRVSGINGNVDLNYTKMSLDTLRKYGKP
jgi:lysozyme